MISGIVRFLLFRVFGARVVLVLTVLGWLRNRLRGRDRGRDIEPPERRVSSEYRRH